MSSVYVVVFWMFLRTGSCQLQCLTETLDDSEFSLNVTGHIKVETTNCIKIPYELKFPRSKVTLPYKKMLFKGDPSNIVITKDVNSQVSDSRDSFRMDELPQGEYEFGFKLEWGCNQTYIFPQKLRISVAASTQRPHFWVSPMTAGEPMTLSCQARPSCSGRAQTRLKWTKADGESVDVGYSKSVFSTYHPAFLYRRNGVFNLIPTADHHNTNITCVVNYTYDVIKTSVTLTVKFSPKILNDSRCAVEGKLLVCVCVSWGNPLPPISWPLGILTDYSVSSFSSAQTVRSTITLPADEYKNTTVKCISTNELGKAELEIPLQNSTGVSSLNHFTDGCKGVHEALPWITAVCLTLNLVFIAGLIIFKRRKSKQKSHHEETNTYESLRKADVEQEYDVISSQFI